ncbi:hypothetical protein JANAI62_03690 [Jannaschia pagri]|uniref:Uncharacterized protein n=1 Tax=Jannaschia pagri TaxID=2829797 RepID=A0ABQ4NH53_9RHOB|nr:MULTISPECIES: hypothetical protein [unclassified Jannaschia]GIT90148.1 hypothetical protein JANAI61_06060 [Jannaschia sp. AI_61]GIT93746.1 hypothetical protein JANAI62_03690 [Jannaschia sp. AI_62]
MGPGLGLAALKAASPGLALGASAAAPVLGGFQALQAGRAQKAQAKINAGVARTRADQVDTQARRGLESELGSIRAALGANQQRPGVGTLSYMSELRDERGRERRINVGNQMQAAADFDAQASAAGAAGTAGLLQGFVRAGPSIFNLYNYRTRG